MGPKSIKVQAARAAYHLDFNQIFTATTPAKPITSAITAPTIQYAKAVVTIL